VRAVCGYNAAHAHPALAENLLDGMGSGVGAGLLAAIWGAELSVFLRPGKCARRDCFVEGKFADLFVADVLTTDFSDFVHDRSGPRDRHGTALDRRNGIHVRSAHTLMDSAFEFVSCCHAGIALMGDLATGLRRPRLEISDADCLDGSAGELFLAAAVRRELGSRTLFSRAARHAGISIFADLPGRGSCFDLLSDASIALVAHAAMAGEKLRLRTGCF